MIYINNIFEFDKIFERVSFFIRKNKHKESNQEKISKLILNIIETWLSKNRINDVAAGELLDRFDKELLIKIEKGLLSKVDEPVKKSEVEDIGEVFLKTVLQESKRAWKEWLIDFDDLRNKLISDNQIEDAEKVFTFYYDETNNSRKLHIEEKNYKYTFNVDICANFIVGGIAFEGNEFKGDIEKLFIDLKLQKSIKDLKAKHIIKNLNFEECLKLKNIKILLKWINENNLYIHFSGVDNLCILCRDIAKLLIDNDNEENVQAKELLYTDTLYRFIKKDISKVSNILGKYNYPQIKNDDIESFYGDFIEFIQNMEFDLVPKINKLYELSKMVFKDSLLEAFKNAKIEKRALKLSEDKYIINSYHIYYQILPLIFLNSVHIFDEETEIQKRLDENPILIKGNKIHYTFKKSHEEKMIQISDVVVSFIYRFITFLNKYTPEQLINTIGNFENNQKETYNLFIEILRKSYKKPFFIKNEDIIYQNNKFYALEKLTILNESETRKKFYPNN